MSRFNTTMLRAGAATVAAAGSAVAAGTIGATPAFAGGHTVCDHWVYHTHDHCSRAENHTYFVSEAALTHNSYDREVCTDIRLSNFQLIQSTCGGSGAGNRLTTSYGGLCCEVRGWIRDLHSSSLLHILYAVS